MCGRALPRSGASGPTSRVCGLSRWYADLTALFCTAEGCPVVVGNALVYRDDSHLTIGYAQMLAPVVGALADHTLARG